MKNCLLLPSALLLAVWTFGAANAQTLSDDLRPTTADDSCEFGYRLASDELWESAVIQRRSDRMIDLALQKAITYCKNGDSLMVARGGPNARGYVHDYFSVAALLCRRPDIQETKKPPLQPGQQAVIEFRCTITKVDALKAKGARGEPLFKWPNDFVDPRPGDNVPRPGEVQAGVSTQPPKATADCKDPKSPHYADRCGISPASPPKN